MAWQHTWLRAGWEEDREIQRGGQEDAEGRWVMDKEENWMEKRITRNSIITEWI